MKAFRNGETPELAEAECTDSEIKHYSRHSASRILERYTNRKVPIIGNAERKREVYRNAQKLAPDTIKTRVLRGPRERN